MQEKKEEKPSTCHETNKTVWSIFRARVKSRIVHLLNLSSFSFTPFGIQFTALAKQQQQQH